LVRTIDTAEEANNSRSKGKPLPSMLAKQRYS